MNRSRGGSVGDPQGRPHTFRARRRPWGPSMYNRPQWRAEVLEVRKTEDPGYFVLFSEDVSCRVYLNFVPTQ